MEFYDPRPVIGISGGRGVTPSLTALISQIRSVGGIPKVFNEQDYDAAQKEGVAESVSKALAQVDALYVLGNNNDIDPAVYGAKAHPATNIETDTARRDFETLAIEQALEKKMPLVGICGGLQRINTLNHAENGGTLEQHVPDVVGHDGHQQGDTPPYVPVQVIKPVAATMVEQLVGKSRTFFTPSHSQPKPNLLEENSFHHQAVGQVHKEFRVSAYSEDGVVEAIEPKPGGKYAQQFVLGVQWHPEFSASDFGPKLADRVVEHAKVYAQDKWRNQEAGHLARITTRREAATQSNVIGM